MKNNKKDYEMISLKNYIKLLDEIETEKRIKKTLKEFDSYFEKLINRKDK